MIINHNLPGANAISKMNANSATASKSMQKLSSGLRINNAADDAAGLAISEKMRGQIRGLDQASANAQDAISMTQTAEGALGETTSILQRMRELAVQSSTDTNTADDRDKIQGEVDQLAKEITRISNTTEFNTQNLMAGGLNNTFQIGANKDQNITLSIGAMDAKTLGVSGDLDAYGLDSAETGVTSITKPSQDLSGYKVVTSAKQAATVTAITKSDGAIGNLVITSATTYDGSVDQNFTIRTDSVDGSGKVLTASVSRDGGTNWSSLTIDDTGADSTATLDGLALTLTTNADNAANKTWTFGATAEYKKAQLTTSGDVAVGSVVKVYNNQTTANIGLGDKNVTIGFSYAGLASDAQTDIITKTTTASTAATIASDGTVATKAETQKGIAVNTQASANSAIETIDKAINTVSSERSKLGAYSNRLDHTIANLGTSSENLTSAESRIRDVDMAKEMATFSKNNILSQAAQAMLAQANTQPQQVLQLLR